MSSRALNVDTLARDWMKYYELDKSELKGSAKWRVTGYSVLLMATWFTCGIFSYPGFVFRPEKGNLDYAKPIAYVAMILFLLGFLFLLISERKAFFIRRQNKKGEVSARILECKWGLIEKKYIDDFFEVLRWSKEFGVDSSEGRQIKQGVIGVFAGSAFDPKESVKMKDESVISLASYAARINVQLLKVVDFDEKMRERGFDKDVTAQKICRIAARRKRARAPSGFELHKSF